MLQYMKRPQGIVIIFHNGTGCLYIFPFKALLNVSIEGFTRCMKYFVDVIGLSAKKRFCIQTLLI